MGQSEPQSSSLWPQVEPFLVSFSSISGCVPVAPGGVGSRLRVPVSVALWGGDEETGCGGSVFYDASVKGYVPGLEVAGLTVWRLRNVLDPGVRWGYHQYT